MAKASLQDQFPNIMTGLITMSGVNTITFEEIQVGVNLFDKCAILVQRIEMEPAQATLLDLDTDGDQFVFAFTHNENLAALNMDNIDMIDKMSLQVDVLGAVVSKWVHRLPFIHDFSTLRGGGVLIPPKPLYAAAHSVGMTVAGACYWRMYMSIVRLEDAQYLELLETRRAFG